MTEYVHTTENQIHVSLSPMKRLLRFLFVVLAFAVSGLFAQAVVTDSSATSHAQHKMTKVAKKHKKHKKRKAR